MMPSAGWPRQSCRSPSATSVRPTACAHDLLGRPQPASHHHAGRTRGNVGDVAIGCRFLPGSFVGQVSEPTPRPRRATWRST
jgi:hypothetical protein